MVLAIYMVLGAVLSVLFGRKPGTFAADMFAEVGYPAAVLCCFFLWYSVFDVMTIGAIRASTKCFDNKQDDVPEPLRLALRAQGNQVEQMTNFVASTFLFSVFVNGKVGAIIAAAWVSLRAKYADTYRSSVGLSWEAKALSKFTIPCYFMLNAMAAATVVHMLRFTLGL
mmetsp:Transcript_4843/g.14674  ORF Transcript_4843/g.14674 Transcript_4843/m.14674 type:complete len:169 (+) Transcript_4843:30-536(+)